MKTPLGVGSLIRAIAAWNQRALSKTWTVSTRLLFEHTISVLTILFGVGFLCSVALLYQLQTRIVQSMALQDAARITDVMTEFRTLYTANVVEVVRPHGIEVAHDYKNHPKTIPLPATFTMELGSRIGVNGHKVPTRLYSPYPFPHRLKTGGLRDEFGREAWAFLTKNPNAIFSRFEELDGIPSLRYATADVMRAACVNCHNTHPETPKRDWKLGDVRGILEVGIPLAVISAQTRGALWGAALWLASLGGLGFSGLAVVIGRLRRTSKELKQRVQQRTAALETEIAERKQTDERLVLAATLPEQNPNPVVETDLEGQVTYQNPASRVLLANLHVAGMRHPFLLGLEAIIANFCTQKSDDSVQDVTREVECGGAIFQQKICYFSRRGLIRIFANDVTRLKKQISDRKRAEATLGESEERFRKIFEHSNDAIFLVDPSQDEILDTNSKALQMLHYSREELLRLPMSALHPTEMQELKAFAQSVFENGSGWTAELSCRTKSGHLMPCEISASVIEVDGRRCMLALVRDITERKLVERRIRQLNTDLERRVSERTSELSLANEELAAFSYSVSHDLRAPLRSMNGFSRAVLEAYGDKLDAQGADYLERILSASLRMGQLIDAMLSLSRLAGSELQHQTVDLSAAAQTIVAELRSSKPDRRVTFHIHEGVVVNGDPRLLRVVLVNLLNNAYKFTQKQPDAQIEFGVIETGDETVCFIRDNGAGFDTTYADKLFVPFQRLHGREEFEGIGIGLATVQRVIHRHGGRIWAEGIPGRGATFFFSLSVGRGSGPLKPKGRTPSAK